MEKKTRVIEVSSPQRASEAIRFARHFKDLFKPFYLYAGEYCGNGRGLKYPMYYVVRLAEKDELAIDNHEKYVDRKELLTAITEHRVGEAIRV